MSGGDGRYPVYPHSSGVNPPYDYAPYNGSTPYTATGYPPDHSRSESRPASGQPHSPVPQPPFNAQGQPYQVYAVGQGYSGPPPPAQWAPGNQQPQSQQQASQQHHPPAPSHPAPTQHGQQQQQQQQQQQPWQHVYYTAQPPPPAPAASEPGAGVSASHSRAEAPSQPTPQPRPSFSGGSSGADSPQVPARAPVVPSQPKEKQRERDVPMGTPSPHGHVQTGLDFTKLMDSTRLIIDSAPAFNEPGHSGRVQPQLYERMLDSASFAAQMLDSAATQSPLAAPRAGDDDGSGPDKKRQKADVPAPEGQVCLGCNATSTPEWRRGPMGPRTLCNACGLVYAKMIKKRSREGTRKRSQGGSKSGGAAITGADDSDGSGSEDDGSSASQERPGN